MSTTIITVTSIHLTRLLHHTNTPMMSTPMKSTHTGSTRTVDVPTHTCRRELTDLQLRGAVCSRLVFPADCFRARPRSLFFFQQSHCTARALVC